MGNEGNGRKGSEGQQERGEVEKIKEQIRVGDVGEIDVGQIRDIKGLKVAEMI